MDAIGTLLARLFRAMVGVALTLASQAQAQGHAGGHAPCVGTDFSCAASITTQVDDRGVVWRVGATGGRIWLIRSADGGRHFSAPVLVAQHDAALDTGSDTRPQLLSDGAGRVLVAYGVFRDRRYNAQLMLARSTDDGRSFMPPRPVWPESASQRFPVLALGPGGVVVLAWIDKPSAEAAVPQATVSWAWSDDGGRQFSRPRVLSDQACECCRLALAQADGPPSWPWLMFRQVYAGDERDHAVTALEPNGASTLHRVSEDRWALKGCPHHGPALASSAGGVLHAAWFTQGQARQGLFHARSVDGGQTFSQPVAVGDPERQAGRPALVAQGGQVWMAWKEFDGRDVSVWVQHSVDGGRRWGAPRALFRTRSPAGHPQLLMIEGRPWLSWMSREHGHPLLPLSGRNAP